MYSRVFIIVDALDECQASNGCRKRFLSEIFDLQPKYGINVLATSRFMPEVLQEFEGSVRLEIRARQEDVRVYIDREMSPHRAFLRRNQELQEEVKTKIVELVQGMYA